MSHLSSILNHVTVACHIDPIEGFTLFQGSELFVKLESQKAKKTANLDVYVNLILQIEFAQFII